jgi:hypothetical protein
VILLSACALDEERVTINGSGDLVTQKEDISGFDRVRASQAFQVEVRQGDSYRVVIRVDDNFQPHLVVKKDGDALRLGLEPGYTYNVRNNMLKAEVTMPELSAVSLSGSSDATITGFASTKRFDAGLSGSSSLQGDIQASDASFELSGSSQVNLQGSARYVRIDASGSSDIDLSDFSTSDVKVGLSGSSEAILNLDGTLDVDASGASRVYYRGEATLGRIDTSGKASVRRD